MNRLGIIVFNILGRKIKNLPEFTFSLAHIMLL